MDLIGELRKLDALISSGSLLDARQLHADLSELFAVPGKASATTGGAEPGARRLFTLLEARLLAAEGNHGTARKLATAVFEESRGAGDRASLARSHVLMGEVMLRGAEYTGARRHAEAAIYLYTWEVADLGLRGDSYDVLGLADQGLGFWQQAERDFRNALAAYSGINDPRRNLHTSLNLAALLRKRGRITEAEHICWDGVRLSKELGVPLFECRCALELANIDVIRRDRGECERHLSLAGTIAVAHNYRVESALVDQVRGDDLLLIEDAAGASEAYSLGLEKVRSLEGHCDAESRLLEGMAKAMLILGERQKARELAAQGLNLAHACGDVYEYPICVRVLGEIEFVDGAEWSALERMQESVKLLSGLSFESHELALSEVALGRALTERETGSDPVRGREHLFAARRIYSSLGVEAGVREVDDLLSQTGKGFHDLKADSGLAEHLGERGRPRHFDAGLDIGRYGIVTGDSRIVADLARWGDTEVRVLIEGETGVGKELVARAMHAMSRRREERFVAVDCGALSETLSESELFGHARGSFTGADRDRVGLIEEANGGTLFLDEVGELSAALQAKLLRVLEEGVVRRVGENRPRRIDVRILSATTKNLDIEVEASRFRRDLYFRLKGVVVRVPSLKERRGDIRLLLGHFLDVYSEREGKTVRLDEAARRMLLTYEWPGNVRELKHVTEALVVSTRDEGIISQVDAAEFLGGFRLAAGHGKSTGGKGTEGIEDQDIRRALEACDGNKSAAARKLGISRKTLYQRIRDLEDRSKSVTQ